VLGTLDVGRRKENGGYVLGLAIGGTSLGLGLVALNRVAATLLNPVNRLAVASVFMAVLLILQLNGRIGRLAGNFRVPAVWVSAKGTRPRLLWGILLGLGFITEAPFAVLHASVILAILQPIWWIPLAVGVLFALSRSVNSMFKAIRATIIRGNERGQAAVCGVPLGTTWTMFFPKAASVVMVSGVAVYTFVLYAK